MFPIRDHNPSNKIPLITFLIIIITSFVFFLELQATDTAGFISRYALIPSQVNFASLQTVLPFVYSIFLHGGWLHIISNMWFLWIFGDNIEAELGHFTFILFYLLTGIIAGLVQYLLNTASAIPTLGASGAIAGVLGAYLVLFPKNKIDTLVITFGAFFHKVKLPASIILGYWFLIQIFSGVGSLASTAEGGVAWWAHIGGFGAGYLSMKLFSGKKKVDQIQPYDQKDFFG